MDGPEVTTQQPQPVPSETVSAQNDHKFEFFISYSAVDRSWAEWVAWILEDAGHCTIVQAWDCVEGMDLVEYMIWAREHSSKTIALLSDDYLNSSQCMEELKAAYFADPSNELRLLVQLRVRECTPRILPARVYGDLFEKDEAEARRTLSLVFGTTSGGETSSLVTGPARVRRKPEVPPPFPGTIESRRRDDERRTAPDRAFDFFISYSAVDRSWAEWIAWNLEETGHTTIMQAWDCLEGMDFVDYMIWAREHSSKTLALLSDDYQNSPHCMEELKAAYVADPSNDQRLLVQLRVRECTPRILPARVYGDLFDKEEAEARRTLSLVFGTMARRETSSSVPVPARLRRRPEVAPRFPGTTESRPRDEAKPALPEPAEDERIGILTGRLLNAYILLLMIGTVSVGVSYFLGSKAFQDRPEDAYWDRMFNFDGDPTQNSEFGFGPGLIIEVLRQIVLLFFALIAMPLFTFKESARELMLATPARRLLGIGPGAGDGKMNLNARMEFLILIFVLFVGSAGVLAHHFFQGPHELWNTEGYRDGSENHNPQPVSLASGAYWKRCLVPYAVYSVYSSINYLAGIAIVLTLSLHAGISDLLWMHRWSSGFREKCDEGTVGVVALHRRFEREFLVRLGAVLERYYALLGILLTGFAFKAWLDRINLSPRAYEFQTYAFALGMVPVVAAYVISTVFYRSAVESAARQAQNPEDFRRQHRMGDFYGRSIKRSIYLPISLLLLASIAINIIWLLAKGLIGL